MTTTINASNSGGGGLVQTADASGVLALQTAGVTAVTVDTSQNVGIGTASPSVKFQVDHSSDVAAINASGGGVTLKMSNSSANDVLLRMTNNSSNFYDIRNLTSGSAFTIGYNGDERMRIDSSGNVLVGVTANSNSERLMIKSGGNTSSTTALRIENSSSTAMFLVRDDGYLRSPTTYNLTGGTANLSIDSSGFITRATSSLRYKRDIVNYDKGLEVVSQLRPVYYKSSVAGADGNIPDTQFAGMIAEELDALGLTEFVEYGADNQVEAIRYGNMVSLCIKAIQEQQALITSLTARIAALEGTPA